jgi:hypothetical protein
VEGRLKAAYDEVFVNWLQEGIIEEISMSQWDEGHYLPHRPIVKESGTTRVRPCLMPQPENVVSLP